MDPQQTNQQVCHKSSSSSITIINLYPFFCLRRASIHLKNMHFLILFHQTAKTHQPKKKNPDSILDTKTLLVHPTNSSKPIFS